MQLDTEGIYAWFREAGLFRKLSLAAFRVTKEAALSHVLAYIDVPTGFVSRKAQARQLSGEGLCDTEFAFDPYLVTDGVAVVLRSSRRQAPGEPDSRVRPLAAVHIWGGFCPPSVH